MGKIGIIEQKPSILRTLASLFETSREDEYSEEIQDRVNRIKAAENKGRIKELEKYSEIHKTNGKEARKKENGTVQNVVTKGQLKLEENREENVKSYSQEEPEQEL